MDLSVIPSIPLALQIIVLAWAMAWKGFALWKSAKKTKIVWFIFILIINTLGLFEIVYIFVFSKIKNTKQFNKIHDSLLVVSVISGILSIFNIYFLVLLGLAIGFFTVSLLQEIVDKKNWKLLILGIIFSSIVSVIYYFLKVRGRAFKALAN